MNADGTGDRRTGVGLVPHLFERRTVARRYRSQLEFARGRGRVRRRFVPDGRPRRGRRVSIRRGDRMRCRPTAGCGFVLINPLTEFLSYRPDGSSGGGLATNEISVTPVRGGPGIRVVAASNVPHETYWEPVWSPDGSHIAFQSHVGVASGDGPSIRSRVYVVDADGSDLQLDLRLARPRGSWPGLAWSPEWAIFGFPWATPDGRSVALHPTARRRIRRPGPRHLRGRS